MIPEKWPGFERSVQSPAPVILWPTTPTGTTRAKPATPFSSISPRIRATDCRTHWGLDLFQEEYPIFRRNFFRFFIFRKTPELRSNEVTGLECEFILTNRSKLDVDLWTWKRTHQKCFQYFFSEKNSFETFLINKNIQK